MPTPAEHLARAADLHEAKTKEYGKAPLDFGEVLATNFTHGLYLGPPRDFNRFLYVTMLQVKMNRYMKNFAEGGHPDSLKDIIVYAAMLLSLDESPA